MKNIGTGKTVGIEDVWYLTSSGSCVEFTYHLDSDEVWGVLKPQGDHNNMVLDFYYRERVFGIWRKHGGNNQRFRMEGKHLLSKTGNAVQAREDGKMDGSNPVCDDKNEQWEIVDSCDS